MGGIWCSRIELVETLLDVAGYKSGLALTRAQLREHLADCEELAGDDDQLLRIRSDELETMVRDLLFALGTLKRGGYSMPTLELYAKYRTDAHLAPVVACISEEFVRCGMNAPRDPAEQGKPIDITPIAVRAVREYGADGLRVFEEFHELLREHLLGSFVSGFRVVAWENIEHLSKLFDDESLTPAHGTFLDQRFIDYLQRNDAALDVMNWRKFEGLVGEYFVREGYQVAMGKGRGDGGVDVRVWHDGVVHGTAPTILVQCKRQKGKIEQVVVKALYADVLHEGADSGLVVTTSALQPGAQTVCSARGYPVSAVDRTKLRAWLETLRTPGSGYVRT